MERYLATPFMPSGKVSCVALDGRFDGKSGYPDLKTALEKRNIRVIMVPPCSSLPEGISSHPDLQLHHLGGDEIIVASNVEDSLVDELEQEGFNVIYGQKKLGDTYPDDTVYNALPIGKYVLHNHKITDPILKKHLDARREFHDIKQGYSKCLTVIINENTIMTEDSGIAKAASKLGLKVLYLNETGNILLPPYKNGFLGGASGLLTPDLLAFSGSIEEHPGWTLIKDFLRENKMDHIFLSDDTAWDIGSIIPLKEWEI